MAGPFSTPNGLVTTPNGWGIGIDAPAGLWQAQIEPGRGVDWMIDLRSDTVTKPTSGMLRAMIEAPVGDDVIDIDPTVAKLQERVADLLAKESAIFMPSGTMTNQIALRVHCSLGDEFLCDADCHIYNYEQGAFAQLSGLAARTVQGIEWVMELSQFQELIRPDNDHMVRTRLLCLENTHNRGGGRILPHENTVTLCRWAHEAGIQTHLDGARLFNASVASGVRVEELARPFDSVSICFSKGLGAPVGSCLAGSKEFIAKARRARKLFGGGMRQSGFLAAAALYAMDHHVERLAIDHEHAERLAHEVQSSSNLSLLGDRVDTNIVIFRVDPTWGTAGEFVAALLSLGVQAMAFSKQSVRLVTHLDVSSDQIDQACHALRSIASQPAGALSTR
jgi:threonine aldolase